MAAKKKKFGGQYKIEVATKGVEVIFNNGLTIYVYPSTAEEGRVVVELETTEGRLHPQAVRHDRTGRPQLKVMINEAVISNDGGEEPVTRDPYNEPHVVMTGNLSEGFKAVGPFKSFDEAAECHEAQEYSWVMTLDPPT